MKLECIWNDKMKFTAKAGEHQIAMDTQPPIGSGTALSPKQLLLAGVSGCTAMDVVSLMRKYRQPLEGLEVDVDAPVIEGTYPTVFKEIRLHFKLKGELDADKVMESVHLSQSKYCSVSAMVSKAAPIHYTVELNGKRIGSGHADFKF